GWLRVLCHAFGWTLLRAALGEQLRGREPLARALFDARSHAGRVHARAGRAEPRVSVYARSATMTASFEALIADYGVPAGHFGELLAAPRTPHPYWAAFGGHAGDLGPAQLSRAQARVARQIHENGVTYNVYADAGSPERPWALDVLPHLVSAADW